MTYIKDGRIYGSILTGGQNGDEMIPTGDVHVRRHELIVMIDPGHWSPINLNVLWHILTSIC